jgi:cyclic pyranopterin phosphate synthase
MDRFGRVHAYLRVSVTDRCNYRCVYCMPAEGMSWMPRAELLRYEEIARVVGVLAPMGVRRVRLTGGEPTVRRDIEALVGAVAAVPGVEDVALTTNGHTLAGLAAPLRARGLRRVNVSLDSLDPARFTAITRGGDLARVLAGVDAALDAGLLPVKINMVVMEGVNDDEVVAMVRRFAPHGDAVQVRLIEAMPFETNGRRATVPASVLREHLAVLGPVRPEPPAAQAASSWTAGIGPARHWRVGEGRDAVRVGFIAPLTEHFCATCNRLRLLADGHLRTCLAHEDTPSLRDLLRAGASEETLAATVRAIVRGKPAGHEAALAAGRPFEGVMTGIGG